MKKLCIALFLTFTLIPFAGHHPFVPGRLYAEELSRTPVHLQSDNTLSSACAEFNALNTRIRDGKISRVVAQSKLKRLLSVIRQRYYQSGEREYSESGWVFPLAGYDIRAISAGRSHGFLPRGYDYFDGNRHGGHPAYDIFIHDRDENSRDDLSGRPVTVLSMTGGVVAALEREWKQGSRLRGGKYIWIYDPAHELLVYYAHNDDLLVKLGQVVGPGERIAIVGRSGFNAARKRSPTHLHLSALKVRNGRPLAVNAYQNLARAKQ